MEISTLKLSIETFGGCSTLVDTRLKDNKGFSFVAGSHRTPSCDSRWLRVHPCTLNFAIHGSDFRASQEGVRCLVW
ncbi:hypothetical protein QWZ13_02690 [Reinekea marina]|uniref:hypothetical protein n=1 Tax=Reinekea marina TaxID=1310421 RepID=UPI0025B3F1E9|nr:hypothetical protein [Reinekea marina]MDN3647817.1 hypothetical protein [Reinekea marina]